MEYWRGIMNWPTDKDWRCETCGNLPSLTWGLVHGECRCDFCHTQYMMRDYDAGVMVTRPMSLLKDDYKVPAKTGWLRYGRPISDWDDDEWDAVMSSPRGESEGTQVP